MRYPNKSLEIPLETFSKVAPEKLALGDAASASGQAAMTVAQLALPTSVRRNAA